MLLGTKAVSKRWNDEAAYKCY